VWLFYTAMVNGKPRGQYSLPSSPREWRQLAHRILSQYTADHIEEEVKLGVSLQLQNRDDPGETDELPQDWKPKPVGRVRSALAAYYVELLMVMPGFRCCATCGADISHSEDEFDILL
jgi:hypothetical protein